MPSSVKITDLPAISSIQRGDIIPVVDESQTQTNKATLGQIKDMECGAGTVVNTSIVDAAVTANKLGFSTNDKLAVATSSHPQSGTTGVTNSTSNADGTFNGREIICTPYIQALMAQQTGPQARAYLDALQSTNNPTFTGQIFAANGSETLPSYTFTNNPNTGMYLSQNNVLGFSSEDIEVVEISPTGFRSRIATSGGTYVGTYPHFGVRAWVSFNATVGAVRYIQNPHTIASLVGLWPGTIYKSADNITKINEAVTAANSDEFITLTDRGSRVGVFNAQSGYSGQRDDGRYNYTSPGDNFHYNWNGSSWGTLGPSAPSNWIGSLAIETNASLSVESGGNVASVTVTGSTYRIHFIESMPDLKYCVVGASGITGRVDIVSRNQDYVDVQVAGTLTSPVCVAVLQ